MTAPKVIVEWAPIELADGVDEQTLLEASDKFQREFVSKQEGFIQRDLLKGQNGEWVDLVVWNSEKTAHQAVKNAEDSPACHAFFQLMAQADPDDPGAGVMHYQSVRKYQ